MQYRSTCSLIRVEFGIQTLITTKGAYYSDWTNDAFRRAIEMYQKGASAWHFVDPDLEANKAFVRWEVRLARVRLGSLIKVTVTEV